MKPERVELIPVEPLLALARVYDYGSRKYDPNNWRKGYAWSLSYAACMRHLLAFWNGEDNDPESGLPHLAHAGFHIFSLLQFSSDDERYADLDDRYKSPERAEDDDLVVLVTPDEAFLAEVARIEAEAATKVPHLRLVPPATDGTVT